MISKKSLFIFTSFSFILLLSCENKNSYVKVKDSISKINDLPENGEIWTLEEYSNDTFYFKSDTAFQNNIKLIGALDYGMQMSVDNKNVKWLFKEYTDDQKVNTINTYSFSKVKERTKQRLIFNELVYNLNSDHFEILSINKDHLILLRNSPSM